MNAWFMTAEILASFAESLLIVGTVVNASGRRYSWKKSVWLIFLCAAVLTAYVACMDARPAYALLTQAGYMLLVILGAGGLLSTGKFVLRTASCVLALFVTRSIDYMLLIALTLFHGSPQAFFYLYLQPGASRVYYLLLNNLYALLVYCFFRKHLLKLSALSKKTIWLLLLYTALAYGVLQYLFTMVLYGNAIQLQGSAILSLFVLLCALFTFVFSMITLSASEREKATNQMLASMNQMMEANFYSLNESITGNAKAIHDFHHHLSVIQTLAQKEEPAQISEYIGSVLTASFVPARLCQCGNNILDAVINAKLTEAGQKGIDAAYTIQIEDLSAFAQADICAVLANQIENAFEACEKVAGARRIQIHIHQKEGFVLFKVTNPVAANPFLDNENLASTKTDSNVIHGLGLKNIQDIAKKYNGSLHCEYANGRFISTVLLCGRAV